MQSPLSTMNESTMLVSSITNENNRRKVHISTIQLDTTVNVSTRDCSSGYYPQV